MDGSRGFIDGVLIDGQSAANNDNLQVVVSMLSNPYAFVCEIFAVVDC